MAEGPAPVRMEQPWHRRVWWQGMAVRGSQGQARLIPLWRHPCCLPWATLRWCLLFKREGLSQDESE